MYPVNDYILVKEIKANTTTTVGMLKMSEKNIGIKKYEIVKHCYAMSDEAIGDTIVLRDEDVNEFFDGLFYVSYKDIIAREDKK